MNFTIALTTPVTQKLALAALGKSVPEFVFSVDTDLNGLAALQDLTKFLAALPEKHKNAFTPGQLYIVLGNIMDIAMGKGELQDLDDVRVIRALSAEVPMLRRLLQGIQMKISLQINQKEIGFQVHDLLAILDKIFDSSMETREADAKNLVAEVKEFFKAHRNY